MLEPRATKRNFLALADTEDGLDFGGGIGEKYSARHSEEIGESVAFVGVEFGEEGGVHLVNASRIVRRCRNGKWRGPDVQILPPTPREG